MPKHRDIIKTALKSKFIAFCVYIKNLETYHITNLRTHLKALEKQEEITPKRNKQEEIVKLRNQ